MTVTPVVLRAKEIAASALQTACETDPADPEHPDTVMLTTGDFETIVRLAIENSCEGNPTEAAIRAERDDIAQVLFEQRQTPHVWDNALEADPESDAGTLLSICRDDADAVLAVIRSRGEG